MSFTVKRLLKTFKEAYSGHPKEIWVLATVTLINRLGMMVIPFLSVYLTTVLDFSLQSAGTILSAFGLGSLGGSYLGGKLSDKVGPNGVIISSLASSGLVLIGLQFFTDFYSLFALIFLASLIGEAYRPALSTAIANYVEKQKTGRTMAFMRLAINLGMSASPLIGGFVAVSLGYHILFWIDGTTCILAALYFAFASRKWKSKVDSNGEELENTEEQVIDVPPYRNKRYLILLLSSFLIGFAFIQGFHSVPVFIKTEWGFDERYIGTLMAFNCFVIVLIEMPLVDAIEKAQKVNLSLFIGAILIGGSFLFLALPKSLVFGFISIFVWTIGEVLFLPFNSSIALNMSPESRRGDYMAWYWMTWSFALIVAPFGGLTIAGWLGFDFFWISVAVLTAVTAFATISARRSGRLRDSKGAAISGGS